MSYKKGIDFRELIDQITDLLDKYEAGQKNISNIEDDFNDCFKECVAHNNTEEEQLD